jgi:hypothetical protein
MSASAAPRQFSSHVLVGTRQAYTPSGVGQHLHLLDRFAHLARAAHTPLSAAYVLCLRLPLMPGRAAPAHSRPQALILGRQAASSGWEEKAAAIRAARGANTRTLQPRKASKTSTARPNRIPTSPMHHGPFNKRSISRVERLPILSPCSTRNSSPALRPSSRSMLMKSHSALSFEE